MRTGELLSNKNLHIQSCIHAYICTYHTKSEVYCNMYIYIHMHIPYIRTYAHTIQNQRYIVICTYIYLYTYMCTYHAKSKVYCNMHIYIYIYIYIHTHMHIPYIQSRWRERERERERIIFITHLKPLQPKTTITDDLSLDLHVFP